MPLGPRVEPRGSKVPTLEDSGPQKLFRVWSLEPGSLNIGYLDPLGRGGHEDPTRFHVSVWYMVYDI